MSLLLLLSLLLRVIPTASSSATQEDAVLAERSRGQNIAQEDPVLAAEDGTKGRDDTGGQDIPPLPLEVLERNRLSETEIRAIPRFANYTPGEPSKVGSC